MNKTQIIKDMILRPPHQQWKALHPIAKKIQNKMTQTPEPLKYKLHDIANEKAIENLKPLGDVELLPFSITRSHLGNLPVYRKYRNGRHMKRTVIRHIVGDINAFKEELSKVVSNSEIIEKVGRIEVKGLHKDTVSLWLAKLGF